MAGPQTERVIKLVFEPGAKAQFMRHRAFANAAGVMSKADRGFHPLTHKGAVAGKSRAVSLPPRATLQEALVSTADAALRDFMTNIPAAHDGDAEGVHQLRVALRRLRSALVFYAPYLERCARKRFSDAIRDLGIAFGTARDWDVFVEETLEAAKADGVGEEWIAAFAEEAAVRREASHHAVREQLDGKAPVELVFGIQAWLRGAVWVGPHAEAASEPIDEVMPDMFDRMARKVERRGRKIERLSPRELHPLRKSIKKLRYSAEGTSELYGEKSVNRYVKRCKILQIILGAINDAQVTARLVGEIVPARSAALAPAAGALNEWNARRLETSYKKLRKAWRRLQRAPAFWH